MGSGPLKSLDHYDLRAINGLQTDQDANGNTWTTLNGTVRQVSAQTCYLLGYLFNNTDTARRWVQIFYRPANEVALGTTPPDLTIGVGASGSIEYDSYYPRSARRGLSIACTTTETGSTGATTVTGEIKYKEKN